MAKKKKIEKHVHVKKLMKTSSRAPQWHLPFILFLTTIVYLPTLNAGFVNWDDPDYIYNNYVIKDLSQVTDFFTIPIQGNYHPLTMISLALNYAISGFDAWSYHLLNMILHVFNCFLVYRFSLLLSRNSSLIAFVTSLLFGIHPMHVESVAWVSERKDVLYTLFFLISLTQYWRFLRTSKNKNLIYCFLFFALSLLSKPAAIILPFVLVLLDHWYGRPIGKRSIVEKIPFLFLSLVFAVITVKLQSKTAIAGLDFYPLWSRFFFATYTSMMYILRFFVPYPLSTFHPFPSTKNLGWPIMLSPLFMLSLLAVLWFNRKNKLLVFSFFFFMINLALVLQIVSIGGTLLAERYTYVPYIGMAFFIGMMLHKYSATINRSLLWGITAAVVFVFGIITFQRTKLWKDSDTLWTNVIEHFPNSSVPRTNRANYLVRISSAPENKERQNELLQRALEDCNEALKTPLNHAKSYENRQNIYLRLNKDSLALSDAGSLIRLDPSNRLGYYTKGSVYQRFNMPDSAILYFNKCLEISPNTDFALNNRGSLLFNYYKKYNEAFADFTKAIQIKPQGDYYLNRSYCYYQLGQLELAKADARTAMQKNIAIPDNYKQLLKL